MSPTELQAPILGSVRAVLQPLGYRKAGSVFSRSSASVVHLIEVQGSRSSTSVEARFTVNVAVFALDLVYPDVRDVRRPSVPAAHWRERLGFLSPEREDLWWRVATQQQSKLAAQDIATRLHLHALPALDALPDIETLVALWQSGKSPGITETQRKEYLMRLNRKPLGGSAMTANQSIERTSSSALCALEDAAHVKR